MPSTALPPLQHHGAGLAILSTRLQVPGRGPRFLERSWSFMNFIFQKQFRDKLAETRKGEPKRILEPSRFVEVYSNDMPPRGI